MESLARLKTVSPSMYSFQQEKIQLPTLSPIKLNYELTITPSIAPTPVDERVELTIVCL